MRTDVPAGGSVTLVVGSVTVRPAGNDGAAVREIVPANDPSGFTVIVELLEEPPGMRVRNRGEEDMRKVGPVTVTKISAEWNIEPLEPSTLTV